ncbi:hypothetical protein [Streptomyces sp. NPDC048496]
MRLVVDREAMVKQVLSGYGTVAISLVLLTADLVRARTLGERS